MNQYKKIYFASDFHLGMEADISSADREKIIVDWMKHVAHDATAFYLLGDIFDYWFEYKSVSPRGFWRLRAQLRELTDSGIHVIILRGNHDLWLGPFFEQETGCKVIDGPLEIELNDKSFFLAHGDEIGNSGFVYKLTTAIFRNSICQKLFSALHPRIGLWIMKFFSKRSRLRQNHTAAERMSLINQYALPFCRSFLENKKEIDFFIMGHWHLPIDHSLASSTCRYINLGDWTENFTYASWDGNELHLNTWPRKGLV